MQQFPVPIFSIPAAGGTMQAPEGNLRQGWCPRRETTIHDKLKIAYDLGRSMSMRSTAMDTGWSKSLVGKVATQIHNPPKQGTYKQNMDKQLEDHYICFSLLQEPELCFRKLAARAQKIGIQISASTICRRVNEMGFKSQKQQRTEKLTQRQKDRRVNFAKTVKESSLMRLPWVFSDECMVCINPQLKKVKVWPGLDIPSKWTGYSGYLKKVMVWACIRPNFKSRLRVDGSLTAEGYIRML